MKQLISYFPLFSVIIIAFGYAQMHFYYSSFGIEIGYYISLNEIILSFFPTIINSIVIFSSILLLLFTVITRFLKWFNGIKKEKTIQFYNKYHIGISTTFFLIGFTAFSINSVLKKKCDSDLNILLYSTLSIVDNYCLFISGIFFVPMNKLLIYSKQYKYLVLIIFLLPSFAIIMNYESIKAKRIKNKASDIQVSFIYKNLDYTNIDNSYIGETSQYIFLWNKQNKTVSIIPKSEVSNFSLKIIN